jgi:hypothetical protein
MINGAFMFSNIICVKANSFLLLTFIKNKNATFFGHFMELRFELKGNWCSLNGTFCCY